MAGVTKVSQLIFPDLNTETEIQCQPTIISQQSNLTLSKIQNFHTQAKAALPGSEPQASNHLLAENLYKLHYGERWEEEMTRVSTI